jgi:DNA-binding transcriptional LysR family regulator
VKLELRELTLPQQFDALRRGDVEVALLRPPVADADLASETIHQERFVLALPARHPLTALARVPARRLAAERFVMFPRQPGLVFHDLVMDFCLRSGFTPRVAQEAYQTHTVIGLVSAGIGVALVPASTQKIGLAGVAYRPLREATPSSKTAVAWRRFDSSPVVKAFLDVARRVAKQVNSAKEVH